MNSTNLTRRNFIKGTFAAAVMAAAPSLASAYAAPSRRLYLYNTHTGEFLKTTYWEKGSYISGALTEINHVLRDHRNGEISPIDQSLLNLVHALYRQTGSHQPFEIISGYRSPQTNSMLHANSHGVAAHSLHMEGKAIDIRLSGERTRALRDLAMDMQKGGVGYYPSSDFVHVDVGRVRYW